MQMKWMFGATFACALALTIGARLFWQTPPVVASEPVSTVAGINEAEPPEESEAARRYRTGSVRHWRQLMLRK